MRYTAAIERKGEENKMKKFLTVLLVLLMALGTTAALADTIKMGTNASFPPFEYIGDGGEVEGFEVEIAKLIAEALGKELEINDLAFDGLLLDLEAGTIDFILSGMTITPERAAKYPFSDPYFNASQAVIVVEGYEGIQTIADITDKKVAVQEGTTGAFMVEDTFQCDPSKVAAFKTATDTVLELKTGRVDCIVIDDAVAKSFLKTYDGLTIVEGLDMPLEQYGIPVKEGNDELLAVINETLAKIKEDGTYDELILKYFE